MKIITKTVEIDGKTLSFETGKIAKQADGSTVVSMGDTMVLVTACSEESQRKGVDFLPLTVDYRENTYASGRIPGGFFKREGRPTEREILTCRVIDRGLRPLFPDGYHRETQVIAWVLSADGVFNSDIYGISGASLALLMSPKIPFTEAIAGVRIGRIDGKFVIFPTFEELKESELDLVVAGTDDALAMVECGATELSESVILDALDLAHQEIKRIIALQHEIVLPIPYRGPTILPKPCGAGGPRSCVKPSRFAANSSRRTPSRRSGEKPSPSSAKKRPTKRPPGSRTCSVQWSRPSLVRPFSISASGSTAALLTRSGQ
jgi:polyribonucleotide nucleotidyltransferase